MKTSQFLVIAISLVLLTTSCGLENNEPLTLNDFGYCVLSKIYYAPDDEEDFDADRLEITYQNGYQLEMLVEIDKYGRDTFAWALWDGPYVTSYIEKSCYGNNTCSFDSTHFIWRDRQLVAIQVYDDLFSLYYNEAGKLIKAACVDCQDIYKTYLYIWEGNNVVRVEALDGQGTLIEAREFTYTHRPNIYSHFSWIIFTIGLNSLLPYGLSFNEIATTSVFRDLEDGTFIVFDLYYDISETLTTYNRQGFPVIEAFPGYPGEDYFIIERYEYENCPNENGIITNGNIMQPTVKPKTDSYPPLRASKVLMQPWAKK